MKSLLLRLICVTVLLLGSVPAYAADEIGLSRDGANWSSSLTGGLFNSNMRWVPGDSETETFYVRNQGPTGAFLTIEARSADTDELLSNEDISIRARVPAGNWVVLQNGSPSESLTEQTIDRGGVAQVDVNATFDPASTNQSQRKELALSFTVTLTEALDSDDGSGHGGIGGLLPATGTQISVWLLVIAGVTLAVGSRLVRRRQEVRHD